MTFLPSLPVTFCELIKVPRTSGSSTLERLIKGEPGLQAMGTKQATAWEESGQFSAGTVGGELDIFEAIGEGALETADIMALREPGPTSLPWMPCPQGDSLFSSHSFSPPSLAACHTGEPNHVRLWVT